MIILQKLSTCCLVFKVVLYAGNDHFPLTGNFSANAPAYRQDQKGLEALVWISQIKSLFIELSCPLPEIIDHYSWRAERDGIAFVNPPFIFRVMS